MKNKHFASWFLTFIAGVVSGAIVVGLIAVPQLFSDKEISVLVMSILGK